MIEFDIITKYFAPHSPDGLRDDVAIIDHKNRSHHTQIITTDTLVESIHFFSTDPPETLGQKLVRVNVSDIFAKGGRPTHALLNLGWPKTRPPQDLEAFALGFTQALKLYDISLLGGDTVCAPCVYLSLTLIGTCGPKGPVTRAGARHDDDIWVTGKIGAGYVGLQDVIAKRETAASAHFRQPQLPINRAADMVANFANASLDVSDGLLQDGAHIAKQSDVHLHFQLEDIPLFASAQDAMGQITGGDDYQILFTAPRQYRSDCALLATKIGYVDAEATHDQPISISLNGDAVPLPETLGHQHIL